jgi:type I restriction enzyme S subunit
MTGATIGKVGIYDSDDKALLNQRNGIIKSKTLNTFYLMNLLNTEIYQSQILKNSVGGAQPNISETDITRIGIPIPPKEKQDEIAAYIQNIRAQAKQLQEEAKAVLEEAKREAEKMIFKLKE